ncbi:tissue-type plasminogen activator [Osmerus mordax]|uniref:tissue-type plasminogen activator n=1 Tax=Osmerus mordax TaxID=8014 RepID=UPI0035108F70
MYRTLGLFIFLSALCCALTDEVELRRSKRGTRYYRARCVDGETAAVRNYGESWMRWSGQRAEYCRCSTRGRERCHFVPVISCYVSRCYNGGTCKEAVYSSDYLCQCPPGFMGSQCEIGTSEKCVVGQGGGYRGTWRISRSGSECINWNSTSLRGKKFTARRPDADSLGLGNHNFCRNPDSDSSPWCYVYRGVEVSWELCSLPKCPAVPNLECVLGSGQSYRGTTAVTKGGSRCLSWDSPIVSRKIYTAWRSDARTLGLGSHNFCRNPDGERAPWCHVYENMQLTWEVCDITKCSGRPGRITTLGPRAPTTNNNHKATCGQRIDNSLNMPAFRIHGGQESDITEQPWQAVINVYRPRRNIQHFLCGAVLIDSCWVLSAAHCFDERFKAENLQVVLGRTFRKQNSSSEQIFEVEKYWIHENYVSENENFDHDIVLMKLKSDIGLCAVTSPEVTPACLPDPNLALPDWTECEISGYGRKQEFDAEYSERVKRGRVRLWPQDRCVPGVLSGRPVTANMLCAGDTRGLDDACKGDSGGPLVCPKDGRMTLMGLISWGDGCGKRDVPGVYTRVTRYTDWIKSKMQAN